MARRKTVRVDSRCSRKPVVGMTTAIVSMNAVVSHCPVRAATQRSAISRGRATPMIVSFRMTTKAATSRVPMIRRGGTAGTSVGSWVGKRWCHVCSDLPWASSWMGPRPRVLKIRLVAPGNSSHVPRQSDSSRYERPLTVRNGFRRKVNRARDPDSPCKYETGRIQ